MLVHHLNCGSMRLFGVRFVCHVLLVETSTGLALVDTGFGTADIADPKRRIGPVRHVIRPVLDREETALVQVRGLGYDPADVRDIVLTHFDTDHTGGLADFPNARVHVTADEWSAATAPATRLERNRYRPAQWAHTPRIVSHGPGGDVWRGFAAARPLDDLDDGVVLIPLPGHTRGHAAVAVAAGSRWILHAGDAFFDKTVITGAGRQPLAVHLQERAVAHDWNRVRANHDRLGALHRLAEPDLMIVNAHDPTMLARAKRETG